MRVLWISCLLIGSITCGPVNKGYGYEGSTKDAAFPVYNPSSYPASGVSYQPSSGRPLAEQGYGSPVMYSGPYAGYGASAYDIDISAVDGDDGYDYLSAAEGDYGDSHGFDGGDGEESGEAFFSDVADLDPVSSFSSHSRYQRGRRVFAKTRYTPGASRPPVMPGSNVGSGQFVSVPRKSVMAPTKGGFH